MSIEYLVQKETKATLHGSCQKRLKINTLKKLSSLEDVLLPEKLKFEIRPITDLRNTNEISDICHSRREPVFITKNGYGDLVIMSIETYEEMLETAATDRAINEAEAEFASDGKLYNAKEALGSIRRKHFR